jgi:hypothetical protein
MTTDAACSPGVVRGGRLGLLVPCPPPAEPERSPVRGVQRNAGGTPEVTSGCGLRGPAWGAPARSLAG